MYFSHLGTSLRNLVGFSQEELLFFSDFVPLCMNSLLLQSEMEHWRPRHVFILSGNDAFTRNYNLNFDSCQELVSMSSLPE